jgi:hypothetical protein
MSDDELRDGAWRSWLLVIECLTWGVFPVGVPLPGRSRPLGEHGEGMGRRSSAGCAGPRRQRLSRLGRFPLVLRAARRELGTCHAYKTPDLGPLTVEGFSWREGPAHPARANPEGGTIDVHQQHALARGARSRPDRYRARRESSPARLWLALRYGGQHARASHAAGGCVISAKTADADRGAAAQPWGGLPIFISARPAARS